MRSRLIILAVAVATAAGLATTPAAALDPGDELWVDGPASPGSIHTAPALALGVDGRAWYVWEGEDDSSSGIYARRLDPDGAVDLAPWLVNTTTSDRQGRPVVAVRSDGAALVVWDDRSTGVWDQLRCQLFDAARSPVGPERVVNQYPAGWLAPLRIAVAAGPDGGFVVVWESENGPGPDTSVTAVQARRLSATGVPLGDQMQLNTLVDGRQQAPDVAFLPDGTWLAAWQSQDSAGTDGDSYSIQLRRFDGATPLGAEVQVNTTVAGSQDEPRLAVSPAGAIAVSWRSPDTPGFELRGRLYSSWGSPAGGDRRLDSASVPFDPTIADAGQAVAAAGGGEFLATWTISAPPLEGGADGRGLEARLVAVDGADGTPFHVNSFTTGDQDLPVAAGRPGIGSLVVAWHSQYRPDLEGDAIKARPFASCLFCDDFEAGDAGRWSAQVP